MGRRAPPALRNALEAAAARRLSRVPRVPRNENASDAAAASSSFKPYELTMTFWALTRFGEAPSSDVLERFERRCAASIDAEG